MDRFTFPPLLKAVSKASALAEGMEIHGLAAKLGFDSDPFVETGLVGMYAACGRILEARLVFDKMSHRDVVTWSIMIDGYGFYSIFLLVGVVALVFFLHSYLNCFEINWSLFGIHLYL